MPAADKKSKSECTAEESFLYLQDYFATVDIVTDALSKFEILATDAVTASQRGFFRAKALESRRDLELLTNQRRAFLSDEASIRPPTQAAVDKMQKLATDVAKLAAKESQAAAVIDIVTKGLDAFNKLNA